MTVRSRSRSLSRLKARGKVGPSPTDGRESRVATCSWTHPESGSPELASSKACCFHLLGLK